MLTAAEQASLVTRRIWPSVRPLLDREERRVCTSAPATAKRQLLATLHPHSRIVGDRLLSAVGSATEDAVLLPLSRRVELVPILSGTAGGGFGVDDAFSCVDSPQRRPVS